jgi:transposase
LKPVVKVARMIHGHLGNILTYFDHRITNAMSQELNSKIQTTKPLWAAHRQFVVDVSTPAF